MRSGDVLNQIMRISFPNLSSFSFAICLGLASTTLAQTSPNHAPPFTQCPPSGASAACGILVVVGQNMNARIIQDGTQKPVNVGGDLIVGVQNDSAQAIWSIVLHNAQIADGETCSPPSTPSPSNCPFGEGPGVILQHFKDRQQLYFDRGIEPGESAYFTVRLTQDLAVDIGYGPELCNSRKYPGLILDQSIIADAESFLDEVLQKYRLSINNSYRSTREQQALYDDYRAGKSQNPAAPPGTSRHESGFAFDLNGLRALSFNDWNNLLNTAEKYGFEYLLGDWEGHQKFDWPHFQADPRRYGMEPQDAINRNGVMDRTFVPTCPDTVPPPPPSAPTGLQASVQ